MQALPPRHVYSAIIKNNSPKTVTVVSTYSMPQGSNTITEKISIQPNETGRFEQKTVENGSATFTGHISHIEVEGSKLEAPFQGVNSPVKDYIMEIHSEGGALKIKAVGPK